MSEYLEPPGIEQDPAAETPERRPRRSARRVLPMIPVRTSTAIERYLNPELAASPTETYRPDRESLGAAARVLEEPFGRAITEYVGQSHAVARQTKGEQTARVTESPVIMDRLRAANDPASRGSSNVYELARLAFANLRAVRHIGDLMPLQARMLAAGDKTAFQAWVAQFESIVQTPHDEMPTVTGSTHLDQGVSGLFNKALRTFGIRHELSVEELALQTAGLLRGIPGIEQLYAEIILNGAMYIDLKEGRRAQIKSMRQAIERACKSADAEAAGNALLKVLAALDAALAEKDEKAGVIEANNAETTAESVANITAAATELKTALRGVSAEIQRKENERNRLDAALAQLSMLSQKIEIDLQFLDTNERQLAITRRNVQFGQQLLLRIMAKMFEMATLNAEMEQATMQQRVNAVMADVDALIETYKGTVRDRVLEANTGRRAARRRPRVIDAPATPPDTDTPPSGVDRPTP
jgi:hypothetical protein